MAVRGGEVRTCSAGRGSKAGADDAVFVALGVLELWVHQLVKVAGFHHVGNRVRDGRHPLVHELARDRDRGLASALPAAALEHEELLLLYGELNILQSTTRCAAKAG
jgi:hypothetical protein